MVKARVRPATLGSTTTRFATEYGHLYMTVTVDDYGQPFEVFSVMGKSGSIQRGMSELACRLVSMLLRRKVAIAEVIEQCQGIQEMQPWPNVFDGESIYIKGVGDAIAHVLDAFR